MKFDLISAALVVACAYAKPIIMPNRAPSSGNAPELLTKGPPAISQFPKSLSHGDIVNKMKTTASPDLLKAYIVRLTQFPERYYKSKNGVASAQWIYQQIADLIPKTSSDVVLTVKYFNHTWLQPSVIARLESKTSTGAQDVVITGSHFDTAANGSPQGEGIFD